MSKKIFAAASILLVGIVAVIALHSNAKPSNEDFLSLFSEDLSEEAGAFLYFLATYGKEYSTKEEFLFRFSTFGRNYLKVKELNAASKSATFAINQFSDLADEEYRETYLGLSRREIPHGEAYESKLITFETDDLPDMIDWREHGAVNPVQDQGKCGSCWAFSAVAAVEGSTVSVGGGELVKISEQELVDCTRNNQYHNYGCKGGMMDNALDYVWDEKGLNQEKDYPYDAIDGSCWRTYKDRRDPITGWRYIKHQDQAQMQAAVAREVVSIGVDAGSDAFRNFKSGYLQDECTFKEINHGVAIVGYTEDAWIVRNSWGQDWGDAGYLRIGRYGENYGYCGIYSFPIYTKVQEKEERSSISQ